MWFDAETTTLPLQTQRLWVRIALGTVENRRRKNPDLSRTELMKQRGSIMGDVYQKAWREYWEDAKHLPVRSSRRFTKAAFRSSWNRMLASVQSSGELHRHEQGTKPRNSWTVRSPEPLAQGRYAYHIDLIVQMEADDRNTTKVFFKIYESDRLIPMIDACERTAIRVMQDAKTSSRLKVLAANVRTIVKREGL